MDFEMFARDPEWQHIAVAVTIDASNEHLIRFICDGKVVSEMYRESTPSNIAELLSSSVSFHVGPPNVQSFPTLFQGFRAKDFEPSLLLADTCVAVCPEGALKLADFSLQGLVHQGTLHQATRPHPVHGGDSLHQRWTASRTCCWEWRSVHGLRNHNGNKCPHSERRWKRWIEHTDHDALCVSRGTSQSMSPSAMECPFKSGQLVPQEGQPLFRSHSCLRFLCEFGGVLCPARGYLGLQVRKFCAHLPWCLQGLLGKGV